MKKFFKVLAIAILSVMFLMPVSNANAEHCETGLCSSGFLNGTQDPTSECWAHILDGYVKRPRFVRISMSNIQTTSGAYHLAMGTDKKEQIVFFTSLSLYYNIGGFGWRYIYIDGSAVEALGKPQITSSQIIISNIAPTIYSPNGGWYNGADRCIFAFYNDQSGGGSIRDFYHDGGRFVEYDMSVTDLDNVDTDATWIDVTLTIPAFSQRAQVTFYSRRGNNTRNAYYRKNGSSSVVGHQINRPGSDNQYPINTRIITTDATQKIEVRLSGSSDGGQTIWTDGFFLPGGM